MPMDIAKLRKLVAIDENDALSRFALGNGLFQYDGSPEALAEAADHLTFANQRNPSHLATYHILGQVLVRLGRTDEARRILGAGIERVVGVGEGMGRDLGPAMQELLSNLDRR